MPPIPKPADSPFTRHKNKWKDCVLCSLCETRSKVVFARGKIPCDILFIGEAPGASEDVVGRPFVGPAGNLLDQMIADSLTTESYALTNLIGCIPIGDDGEKAIEPTEESIKACANKIYELISIAKPHGIVFVGKLSEKWINKDRVLLTSGKLDFCTITHPAAILRADISIKGLLVQKAIVTIKDLCEEIKIPF